MAKSKSSKSRSKQLLTFVIASTVALAIIAMITVLVQKPTNTQSDASEGNSKIAVKVVYDSNGDGNYDEKKDDCYMGKIKISFNTGAGFSFNSDGSGCVSSIGVSQNTFDKIKAGQMKGLEVSLDEPNKTGSFVRIIDKNGTDTRNFNGKPVLVKPIEGADTRVVFGLKGTGSRGDNAQAGGCGKPTWDYNGSASGTKSVTYSLALENNCSHSKHYLVWAVIYTSSMGGTNGWTYKFPNRNNTINIPLSKTVDARDSSAMKITVSRENAKNLKSGKSKYQVRVLAAPCKNNDSCEHINQTEFPNNLASYTTDYFVDN